MTLLFFDGFDDYDTAADCVNYGKWYEYSDTSIVTGRNDGKAVRNDSAAYERLVYTHPTNLGTQTVIMGMALKINSASSGYIYSFKRAFFYEDQLNLYFDSVTGLLQLRRGGSWIATGSTPLVVGSWYFIELKFLCDNTFGIAELRINETTDISFSGDTQAQSTSNWQYIRIGTREANDDAFFDFDDFYLLDTTGTHNNSWLGDIQCKIIRPSADYSVQFTAVNAVNNYQAVDDLIGAPNNNTDYVYSNTVGHVDQYSLSDMPAADAVYAVKVNTRAQKDDVNPRFFKQGIKTGINTNESSDYNLGTSYANYIDIFEHQGDVSETAWTESAVNAARSTIEVSA